jgi:hypothetical protein
VEIEYAPGGLYADCYRVQIKSASRRPSARESRESHSGEFDMFDIISLTFFVALGAVTMVPSWRILRRTGLSPWWSLLSLMPLGTIPVLWIVAYSRWPKEN